MYVGDIEINILIKICKAWKIISILFSFSLANIYIYIRCLLLLRFLRSFFKYSVFNISSRFLKKLRSFETRNCLLLQNALANYNEDRLYSTEDTPRSRATEVPGYWSALSLLAGWFYSGRRRTILDICVCVCARHTLCGNIRITLAYSCRSAHTVYARVNSNTDERLRRRSRSPHTRIRGAHVRGRAAPRRAPTSGRRIPM